MTAPALNISANGKRPPKLTKWEPKRWRPEYERMVVLSVMGWSNKKIGLELGYTKEHVSNVLNLDQAEELKERLAEKMREQTMTLPEKLQFVAEKTADRLVAVVSNDALFDKSPFHVIDRGLDVLKGLNHLKGGGNGSQTINAQNAIVVSGDQAQNLFDGMAKSDEARRLHADNEVQSG